MCYRSIGIVIFLQPVSFPFGPLSVPLRYSAKQPTFRTACLQKSPLQPPPPCAYYNTNTAEASYT